jgi:hypothetical protein
VEPDRREHGRPRLLSFLQASTFVRDWHRLGLTDEDLRALELQILSRPTAGAVVAGTGGLRKVRFAPPSWSQGKRGAARVGYSYLVVGGVVFLLVAYAKNERADLSLRERVDMRSLIAWFEREYNRPPRKP